MFVELTRGRSFKGLAEYCLHDVDAKTNERVDFVETRNLGTRNPAVAWRIMAARHYLQDELKEKAGVGRGGRKDGKPVGHLLLSWRDDEAAAENLNKASMLGAAAGALRAIGASEHQAIIIAHRDTAHPHCHIIVNLIGDDGRLKKNWKEKEKLSRFALNREIAVHGEPIVERRQLNWEDRDAGETPVPVKKKSRRLYELDKAAEQCAIIQEFAEQHRPELARMERAKATQKLRHRHNQERLQWCHEERTRWIIDDTADKTRTAKSEIRKEYQTTRRELLNRQKAERADFAENERNIQGSVANALSLIDWNKLIGRKKDSNDFTLSDAFQILTSETARRNRLQHRQSQERERLRAEQRRKEQEIEFQLCNEQTETIRENRRRYVTKTTAMKQRQERAAARLAKEQQRLTMERDLHLQSFRERKRIAKQKWTIEQSAKRKTRVRRPRQERPPRQPREKVDDDRQQIEQATDDFDQRMLDRFNSRAKREFDDRDY